MGRRHNRRGCAGSGVAGTACAVPRPGPGRGIKCSPRPAPLRTLSASVGEHAEGFHHWMREKIPVMLVVLTCTILYHTLKEWEIKATIPQGLVNAVGIFKHSA